MDQQGISYREASSIIQLFVGCVAVSGDTRVRERSHVTKQSLSESFSRRTLSRCPPHSPGGLNDDHYVSPCLCSPWALCVSQAGQAGESLYLVSGWCWPGLGLRNAAPGAWSAEGAPHYLLSHLPTLPSSHWSPHNRPCLPLVLISLLLPVVTLY